MTSRSILGGVGYDPRYVFECVFPAWAFSKNSRAFSRVVDRDSRGCTELLENQSSAGEEGEGEGEGGGGGGGVSKIYKISRTRQISPRTIMEDGARLFATSLACDV